MFGADGLRIEVAQMLHSMRSPALGALNPPLNALSGGGFSVTQPGWASIWSGMPSYLNNCWSNETFGAMPENGHIFGKLIAEFKDHDFYPVWISGKGPYVRGNIPESPHYQVYEQIVLNGHSGLYQSDLWMGNDKVYQIASQSLQEAVRHHNFACFILFGNPDGTGHKGSYSNYVDASYEVNMYISKLMNILPPDTDIVYCSDHGFNFVEIGEVETGHHFAPNGMLATNFPTRAGTNVQVTRETIGRLIYKKAGGNPDNCVSGAISYAMYGVDL